MNISYFNNLPFVEALYKFFEELQVPVSKLAQAPGNPIDIIPENYKPENPVHMLINDIYFLGMVNEHAFDNTEDNETLETVKERKEDYEGLLIFGIELHTRENGLLPTRSQLAEISRAFNREYNYTPVTIIFKYGNLLAFANSERLKYKQEWREGEKVGKISLLRDIDIERPHSGHLRILRELHIPKTGKNAVDTFEKLYKYWQDVFSVSILNKKFYQELQNWYFWAIKEVSFPNQPEILDENIDGDEAKLKEAIKEHKGKNVIRLLTRILFIWFIKEKRLIPEEIFDEQTIADKLIDDFTPQKPHGVFATGKHNSKYYRAILQNLFFATLNQEMGKRAFRKDKQHQNVTNLMRYKSYFKDPEYFVTLMEDVVPFMNGGLFECLDKPHPDKQGKQGGDIIIYNDGFSDRTDNFLEVPDYLFFDVDEDVDLSDDFGSKSKVYKNAKTRGLLEILKSYKFTITENTPIEEDVALDPELLGKVFENLLASYNPETKTTARKQTGSFYTPREIVNYMVDESLIAYLKNAITDWNLPEEELDKKLHQLFSFEETNPFERHSDLQKQIIKALDKAKILDPAVGSGAFPMGVLQKMVHILTKLDPENLMWKELQVQKVQDETNEVFKTIENKAEREEKLKEINNAFDQSINDPDYARKLYLIENCIYGVDIQSIAIQISKLRFFISLVSDQKANSKLDNFGIKPLPNLETRFVAANTLIGIDLTDSQKELFDNNKITELEKELKLIRHKLFSARSKETKVKYRNLDKELRNSIAELVEEDLNIEIDQLVSNDPIQQEIKYYNSKGDSKKVDSLLEKLKSKFDHFRSKNHQIAQQLASWDPYDQNASSPFFDPEWMFDIKEGFDVVIGNPPYIKEYTDRNAFNGLRNSECYQGKMDLWYLFGCKSIDLLKNKGNTTFIATNNWVTNEGASKFRNKVLKNTEIKQFLDFRDFMIFESASIQTMVYLLEKNENDKYQIDFRRINKEKSSKEDAEKLLYKKGAHDYIHLEFTPNNFLNKRISFVKSENDEVLELILSKRNFELDKTKEVAQGIVAPQDFLNKNGEESLNGRVQKGSGIFNLTDFEKENLNLQDNELELIKPFYNSNELYRYYGNEKNKLWVIYTGSEFNDPNSMNGYPNLKRHLDKFKNVITSDNKPYGLHRARKEYFFLGEKILSQRKCPQKPVFTYTNFDCYVSQTYFVIKSNRINQKYLTGLFNSSLIAFWLRHKGKMQGTAYQVDKGPILEIPIYNPKVNTQNTIANLVDLIIFTKEKLEDNMSITFEKVIDAVIFNLYFTDHLQECGIDVLEFIEQDINEVLQSRDFEKLSDTEKEKVIAQLHQIWTNPENEVVKRMAMFKEKSPDILGVIMDN